VRAASLLSIPPVVRFANWPSEDSRARPMLAASPNSVDREGGGGGGVAELAGGKGHVGASGDHDRRARCSGRHPAYGIPCSSLKALCVTGQVTSDWLRS